MTIDLSTLRRTETESGDTTRDVVTHARPLIDAAVAAHGFGDEVWWSLTPSLLPGPNGPQAVYLLFVHLRSPLLGGALSAFAVFENPFGLLSGGDIDAQVAAMLEQLRQGRSEMLASGPTIDAVAR